MIRAVAAAFASLAFASTAEAAPLKTCVIPPALAPAPAETPPPGEIVRDVPVAAYMLALTWSPEWCRTRRNDLAEAGQCRDNHLGFVLHGLWPNGAGSRHPRYCAPAPAMSAMTVRAHFCMTPSAELLQHEWAAHGTCGWRTPEAYFAKAQEMWRTVKAPDLKFPASQVVTAGDVRAAFIARNPRLRRDGLYVKVVDGNRLQEVRLCYDLSFRPAPCLGGLGAPDHARLRIHH